MIKFIELKNFKSIKKHKFPLRNLNILLGLNGMGKSTFIQSILLLRQSNNLNIGMLNLNGIHFNIGNCKDAFYQYSTDDSMVFDIAFDNKSNRFEFSYKPEADYFKTKNGISIDLEFFKFDSGNKLEI